MCRPRAPWSPGVPEAGLPSIDLDPQVQTVHAAIEARFTISERRRR